MEILNLEQVAAILETATIERTIELGHVIVHTGVAESGHQFALINDYHGIATVSYAH